MNPNNAQCSQFPNPLPYVNKLICIVYVCVSIPEAINSYLVLTQNEALVTSCNFYNPLTSLLLVLAVGVVLVTRHFIAKKTVGIYHSFNSFIINEIIILYVSSTGAMCYWFIMGRPVMVS